jgi:hypothetical protein
MKARLTAVAYCLPLFALLWAAPASAFYDPQLQRWVNRDPIQEGGGPNLYQFVRNYVTGLVDPFGRDVQGITMPEPFPRKPFEVPPAGTGGTSGGNLPPAFPIIAYEKCLVEGETRNQTAPYDGGVCPCSNIQRRCFDFERCMYQGTAGTQQTYEKLRWVPQTSCTKCPEGNYPSSKPAK